MADKINKKRATTWQYAEKMILLDGIGEKYESIVGKLSATVTKTSKEDIWTELSNKVSAFGVAYRSPSDCKKRWDNLKCEAKRKYEDIKMWQRKTGGGPPAKPLDAISDKVIGIIGIKNATLDGIPGGIDSMDTNVMLPENDVSEVSNLMPDLTNTDVVYDPEKETYQFRVKSTVSSIQPLLAIDSLSPASAVINSDLSLGNNSSTVVDSASNTTVSTAITSTLSSTVQNVNSQHQRDRPKKRKMEDGLEETIKLQHKVYQNALDLQALQKENMLLLREVLQGMVGNKQASQQLSVLTSSTSNSLFDVTGIPFEE